MNNKLGRKRMRWVGHVARMIEERKLHKVLVGKLGGNRQLGVPRRRWKNGMRMDIGEIDWGRSGFNWHRI
jgi:hypothetical protein